MTRLDRAFESGADVAPAEDSMDAPERELDQTAWRALSHFGGPFHRPPELGEKWGAVAEENGVIGKNRRI